MAPKLVSCLKFVGTFSLGLLTGISYNISAVTIPTLLAFPSASSASLVFTHLTTRALTDLRIWASVSTTSFLLAYAFSPRGTRHPYLLWTSLLITLGSFSDLVVGRTKTVTEAKQTRKRDRKGKLDASYEVLGDSHSEGNGSTSDEGEEEVNGEEVRNAMEGFRFSQSVRAGISAVAFAMSFVGLWGDGA